NATLEAMARALFKSWFIDFDPVRWNMSRAAGKSKGRNQPSPPSPLPGVEGRAFGLDTETAALFPSTFQDSPLGPIPKGWEVSPLADRIELLSGGTPKTSEPDYWDGNIPWFSVKDAPSDTDIWVIHTEKKVTQLGIDSSATQVLPERTTIISARGTVGKLALTGVKMAMNQSCFGVRGKADYSDFFTYYMMNAATAQLQQRTHGTVFDTINRQTFETLNCVFPPATLSVAFDHAVKSLLNQICANLHQSRTLATLRDTLLPKLLRGGLSAAS
ncbi:MAG: restriction endonuclease subunit S, partial [Lentisphaerae bacterium]|nr:restriction endonuclease subunit S [Lentisphaerota bacterium]